MAIVASGIINKRSFGQKRYMAPAPRTIPHTPSDIRWVIPALLILIVQVTLYVWMAPRGFDFTDEAFYFHNFLHWREFTGTVTFFGAYFEWPFRAMGTSIAGIRILSLLLILASGAILMQEVMRFSMRERGDRTNSDDSQMRLTGWHLVAPMASAMLFFSFLTTLRAPSYNLLSLCSMAIATASLLRTLGRQVEGRGTGAAPFLYGIALGACVLSKATSAALMVVAHFVFFAAVNRTWNIRKLAEVFGLILAGFAINLLVLTIEFPGWILALREGLELTRVRGGYGMSAMLHELIWDFYRALMPTVKWVVLLGVLIAVFRRKLSDAPIGVISLLTVALVAVSAVTLASAHRTKVWLIAMAATAFGIWAFELLRRPLRRLHRGDWSELALMALLFVLPLAFSFGTNLSVLGHSIIASIFAFCAIYLRLYRLSHQRSIGTGALAACVGMLCIPALTTQLLALTDVNHPYRRLRALAIQDIPVALGPKAGRVLVDPSTNKILLEIATMAKAAGFTAGQDLLDMTGDGPGVVYAIGGKPLGTPWMLGGVEGSARAAERVIEKLNPVAIRKSWLLTSTDNPRRILAWDTMLARRIGVGSHELAASIEIATPYTWYPDTPKRVNLQLWKPATAATIGKQLYTPSTVESR